MRKNLFFLTLIFLSLLSCQKIINKDLPAQDPKIVANCLFMTDSFLQVHITKSLGSLQNGNFPEVSNASVSVYEGTNHIEDLAHVYEGVYTSMNFKPAAGKLYRMEIRVPDMKNIEASSPTVSNIPIRVDFRDSASVDEQGQPLAEVFIHFQDPGSAKNFYEISVSRADSVSDPADSSLHMVQMYFDSRDPILEDSYNGSRTFKDESIDGKDYTLKLNLRSNEFQNQKILCVTLRSLSEEYYKYITSFSKYQMNKDNPFAEPVQVYTNWNGGFGIFAGYSESSVWIY